MVVRMKKIMPVVVQVCKCTVFILPVLMIMLVAMQVPIMFFIGIFLMFMVVPMRNLVVVAVIMAVVLMLLVVGMAMGMIMHVMGMAFMIENIMILFPWSEAAIIVMGMIMARLYYLAFLSICDE